MIHAHDYEIILSDQKIPMFVLPYNSSKPDAPVLLYDGGQHATLFRSDHDVLLIDHLPAEIRPVLTKCSWVVALEKNKTGSDIARDYRVNIKKVKTNPLTDGI
jgi:hypothetical protein